jgi:hypothetical protein
VLDDEDVALLQRRYTVEHRDLPDAAIGLAVDVKIEGVIAVVEEELRLALARCRLVAIDKPHLCVEIVDISPIEQQFILAGGEIGDGVAEAIAVMVAEDELVLAVAAGQRVVTAATKLAPVS